MTRTILATMRAALGKSKVLKMIGRRQRDMRRRDANDRTVEIPETLHPRRSRRSQRPTAKSRILLHREEAARFGDGTKDRFRVERHERAHVNDFRVDPVFAFQRIRRFERARHHQGQGDDLAAIAAGAQRF